MVWDTAKGMFSAGKDLTLAKKLIISAEDTFALLDKYQSDKIHGTSTAEANFGVPLLMFKRLVEDSPEKVTKTPEEGLGIAKRLHRYALGNSGIKNSGVYISKKLNAIRYESKYRAHHEVEVLHRFLEDVLLDIEMPSEQDYGKNDRIQLTYQLTYHRLYPISDKWESFKQVG